MVRPWLQTTATNKNPTNENGKEKGEVVTWYVMPAAMRLGSSLETGTGAIPKLQNQKFAFYQDLSPFVPANIKACEVLLAEGRL